MAKAKKAATNVNMTEVGQYPSEFSSHGFVILCDMPTFKADLENLAASLNIHPRGLFYAIQYGVSQSMQDSIAGYAKELNAEVTESGEPKYSDKEKADLIHTALAERFDAIRAGEVATRSKGPRVKGVEKLIRDIAWETIVARAAALKVSDKLPKKADERSAMVDKYLAVEANATTARTEAERRANIVGHVDPNGLDELFAAAGVTAKPE